LEIRAGLIIVVTDDNILSDARQAFQDCKGSQSEYDGFLAGFRIRQKRRTALKST
jgi:hypothetical protein